MQITVEISEMDVRKIIADFLANKFGREINQDHVFIQVKSKQNYKSEWENANFKAVYKEV